MSSSPRSSTLGISFGFNKKITKTKITKDQNQGDEIEEEKDFVREVNLKEGIKGEKEKKKGEDEVRVIPCKENEVGKRLIKKEEREDDDDDDEAAKEIIKDLEKWRENQEKGSSEAEKRDEDEVALLNRDLKVMPEVSKQEDYERVPVEGFGMAVLRGMGFREGEGIGGFKKMDVKCIDPVLRPKGLGLGAQRPNNEGQGEKKGKEGEKEEDMTLKRGAKVCLESGPHRGMYGEVEGMDEDSARAFVRLAVAKVTVSVSENALRVVTGKEFKKSAKVINRDMYDEYREKQEKREKEWERDRDRSTRGMSPPPEKKKKKNREREKEQENGHHPERRGGNWARPSLRVRFVDKKYKGGKYFSAKMVIEDVVSEDRCVCRTEEGRVLDEVDPGEQLETVIPRSEGDRVMVLRGRSRGRVARMLWKDKKKCLAAVQTGDGKVREMDFDDVCEYVGHVEVEDDDY